MIGIMIKDQVAITTATEHRKFGRRIARLAGDLGKEIARLYRETGVVQYDNGLIPALGQPYRGWNEEVDGVLWYLLRLYILGDLIVARIPVGAPPNRDHQRQENQKSLDVISPDLILSCVDQSQQNAGSDGHVHLNGPLWFRSPRLVGGNDYADMTRLGVRQRMIGPLPDDLGFPLEIGYTDPTRTFAHLADHGCVARWPYGSDNIYLLVVDNSLNEFPIIGLDRQHRELTKFHLRAKKESAGDLRALFKQDWKVNYEWSGEYVGEICDILMGWLYEVQVMDRLMQLPINIARLRDREISALMAGVASATATSRYPVSCFLHIARDITPNEHAGRSTEPYAKQEGDWTRIVGEGVEIFFAPVVPGKHCADPSDLDSSTAAGQWTILRERIERAISSRVIIVPKELREANIDCL